MYETSLQHQHDDYSCCRLKCNYIAPAACAKHKPTHRHTRMQIPRPLHYFPTFPTCVCSLFMVNTHRARSRKTSRPHRPRSGFARYHLTRTHRIHGHTKPQVECIPHTIASETTTPTTKKKRWQRCDTNRLPSRLTLSGLERFNFFPLFLAEDLCAPPKLLRHYTCNRA